jgi:hypothetical protein
MLFGILAPNDFGYPLYAVWYSCSQRFWLPSLCCLVFLLPMILAIVFILFGILAPNDFGYPVYAVWSNMLVANSTKKRSVKGPCFTEE